jgi:hypothetical protein
MVPPCSDKITRVPSYSFARLVPHEVFRLRGYHPLWPDFPDRSTKQHAKSCWAVPRSLAATEGISIDFSSSGYLDVSVPRVSFTYPMYSGRDDHRSGRVSPFGNLRIKACLPAPRSLSQATTSFIASCRQGIHRMRLFT